MAKIPRLFKQRYALKILVAYLNDSFMLSVSMDTLFYWGNRVAENILIVGNGFDLSHYLPTKYDHFMDVMDAIESSTNNEMSFDDLFVKSREPWFIAKTKEYYQTESIHLDKEQLTEIRGLLKENCWYKYFKDHIKDIKTWIDFEQKIESVLKVFGKRVVEIQDLEKEQDILNYINFHKSANSKVSQKDLKVLNFFDFTIVEKFNRLEPYNGSFGSMFKNTTSTLSKINKKFCIGNDPANGFSSDNFINYINSQLSEFIKIFNLYLVRIIDQLHSKLNLNIQSNDWEVLNKIYSFNYTSTYTKNYEELDTDYLHGRCGKNQNIVLGISELKDDSLRELKAYGFTKYHQKLFKETDYLFLDEYSKKAEESLEKYTKHKATNYANYQIEQQREQGFSKLLSLNINFYIWGHSLDVSDRDYIEEIFSLNDDIDRNVRVVVYYFDNSAKFSLLNNLLAILGKDKVEKWMKKKWLHFKPNPQINFEVEQQQIA